MRITKRRIWWMLAISWMITIFLFSSETADVSSEKSGMMADVLEAMLGDADSEIKLNLEHIIRKIAHLMEYGILALFLYKAILYELLSRKGEEWTKNKRWVIYAMSITSTMIYACTDEFHQLFVQGRSGQLRDVFIDTTGGALALVLILMLEMIKDSKKKRKF